MWYWVRDLLSAQGVDLRLGHAKYLKAISYAKVKTDAVDAATLAQLLRVDLIPEAHMISAEQRDTRDLLRARLVLVGRVLRCRRSIGALLEKYNVATPTALPALPRLQAALHAEQGTLLTTHIRRLEHVLRDQLLPTPNAQRLVWVPGVGKLVAYTLLLEIDDIPPVPHGAALPFVLSLGPRSSRPGREDAAQAVPRWESLSQDRLSSRRDPRDPILRRDPQ